MEAEHTKRINHARAGIASKGASRSLFDCLGIFTPQGGGNELQEHQLPMLDTNQALAAQVHSLMGS